MPPPWLRTFAQGTRNMVREVVCIYQEQQEASEQDGVQEEFLRPVDDGDEEGGDEPSAQ